MVAWNDLILVLCPLEVKSYYEYFLHEKHKVHDSSLYDIPVVLHVGIVSPASPVLPFTLLRLLVLGSALALVKRVENSSLCRKSTLF